MRYHALEVYSRVHGAEMPCRLELPFQAAAPIHDRLTDLPRTVFRATTPGLIVWIPIFLLLIFH